MKEIRRKVQIQWKTPATILQQFCKTIFAFCIFWYFMLLRQRKEYWLSFSEGDNIQYIHLGRNMNFSWDRGFYKVGSKLQNRAFQDPPSQNPSFPKNALKSTYKSTSQLFYRVCPKSWPLVVVSWIPRRCQCCRIAIPYLIVHVQSGFEGLAPSLAIFSSILFMSCKSWRLNLTNWEIAGLTLTKAIRAIQ